MKKLIGVLLAAILLAGCSGGVSQEEYDKVISERDALIENASSNDDIEPSEISESMSSAEIMESSESTMEELLTENDKLLEEMKPKADQLQNVINSSINDSFKNNWYLCDISVSSRNVFSAHIQIDMGEDSIEGVDTVFSYCLRGMDHATSIVSLSNDIVSFDTLSLTLVNNGAPLIIITKSLEEDTYTLIKDGKREVVDSIEGLGTKQPEAEQAQAWYEGGTLHDKTILEWKNASYENKLATCADWIAASRDNLNISITTVDSLKPYCEELVICLDTAVDDIDAFDHTQIASLVAPSLILMGWYE